MLPELLSGLSQSHGYTISVATLINVLIAFSGYELYRRAQRIRGFSGPPGLPIVGNLWQIRGKDAPEQYRVWSRKYGGLYQIQLGNIPALVINSAQSAKDVLITNSQATKSRPEFYTFHKVPPHTRTWRLESTNVGI